jgi:hypothetical protein
VAIDTKYGFSAKQILDRVVSYVGNTSDNFRTYAQDTLNLAQFKYCNAHDWDFLNKTDLALTTDGVTTEYELDLTSIGYNIPASAVRQLWNPDGSKMLRKVESQTIRRIDPESDDGSDSTDLTHWAEIGEQRILLYPPLYKPTILRLDGKILPTPLTNFTSEDPSADVDARLTIPYRYQESFINYVEAICLDRENDDRWPAKRQLALQMIREDVQSDEFRLGDNMAPRIRHWQEQAFDGNAQQLNSILFVNLPDFYW